MISRWEDVARKTAAQLGMSEQHVIDTIKLYAKKTQDMATSPKVMEMDMFGIGTLSSSYTRLKSAVISRTYKIRLQRKYLTNYKTKNNTVQVEKCEREIERLYSEIEMFTALIATKAKVKAGGKKSVHEEYLQKVENNEIEKVKPKRKKSIPKAKVPRVPKRRRAARRCDRRFKQQLPFPDPE